MSTSTNAPYHHGDLRRALLDAALIILERDGEAGIQLRDLARAVNVSPGAPYRHFDSRAALLESLAVIGFQRFIRRMEETAQSDAPNVRMAMGRTYVQFALDNPGLFRLMFSPEVRKENRPGLRMAADQAFKTLRYVIGGETETNRVAALAAWARVHGLAVLLLDEQIALRVGDDMEQLIDAVLSEL
jgi:AcrR family transcriptional regulator